MNPIQEKPSNPKDYGKAPDSVPPAHIKKPQRSVLKQGVSLSQTPAQLNGTINTPNLTYRVMTKMAFGPSDADIEHINNLSGANELERIFAYIDEQLDFENISDDLVDNYLNQGFETLNKSQQQMYEDHQHDPETGPVPIDENFFRTKKEVDCAFLVRAVHSKRQLFETMTDFWHDHFNVNSEGDYIQPMFLHYDRDVIRPNSLGNFRDLMYDVTRSNSMLAYLGNAVNERSAPNENFARELLELHTISAKNYFGHMNWQDVPIDNEGRRTGYVEADVVELARALTGWSFSGGHYSDRNYDNISDAPTGLFLFRPDWHDEGVKRVMGTDFDFDSNDPEKDVNDILDMLAEHPATAEFLAFKLCRRFVADVPPENLVTQVADSLHQNWQASDQIKQAMEILLKSPEFLNSWGEKIKRPLERAISGMRQVDYRFGFNPDNSKTNYHIWKIEDTGQRLYSWVSPDGFPDKKSHWLSASSIMSTWRFIQWYCWEDDEGEVFADILNITLNAIPNEADRTARNIVNYWYEKCCGFVPEPARVERIIEFMSYDDNSNPVVTDFDAAIDIEENNWPSYNSRRLSAVVTTILLTADFSYR